MILLLLHYRKSFLLPSFSWYRIFAVIEKYLQQIECPFSRQNVNKHFNVFFHNIVQTHILVHIIPFLTVRKRGTSHCTRHTKRTDRTAVYNRIIVFFGFLCKANYEMSYPNIVMYLFLVSLFLFPTLLQKAR